MNEKGDFPWGGVSQPGWGRLLVKNMQESETEARLLREVVFTATEAGQRLFLGEGQRRQAS